MGVFTDQTLIRPGYDSSFCNKSFVFEFEIWTLILMIWSQANYARGSIEFVSVRTFSRGVAHILNSEFWTFSRGAAHIHFVQNDLFGAVRSRAGRRSSPNTKYKIPRWNLGEFLNRPQASGHTDPLTPIQYHRAIPPHTVLLLSCSRFQSVELRGPRVCS